MINKLTKISLFTAVPLLIAMLSGCSSGNTKQSETVNSSQTASITPTGGTVSNTTKAVEIDFKDYIEVKFSGYSGSGKADVSVNYDAMTLLLSDGGSKDTMDAYAVVHDVQASSVENNGKLSNGDKVKIEVSYNEKAVENANVKVKNTELEFEVSGLEEKEVLDIFKDVEIVVSEIYIEGETDTYNVNVKYNGKVKDIYYGKFKSFITTDKDGNDKTYYKEGETVLVTIPNTTIENYEKAYPKYTFLETSKEYTVTAPKIDDDEITSE